MQQENDLKEMSGETIWSRTLEIKKLRRRQKPTPYPTSYPPQPKKQWDVCRHNVISGGKC